MKDEPELTDAEVARIYKAAEAWRKRHGLTNKAFIERFRPYVINSKGWWLLQQPLDEWDAGRDKLRKSIRGLIPAMEDADRAGSLSPMVETEHTDRFRKALAVLRRQRDEKRCLFILGETGAGKSTLLRYAESQLEGRHIVRIRGREAWKSPREMLRDWGAALGIDSPAHSVAAMQTQVRDALLETRDALIFVDEAHRLTAGEINMLIDWVNDCVAEHGNSIHFVIAAVDTLWRKLSAEAREEADQLRINRGCDVITLTAPDEEEISALLAAGCRAEEQLAEADLTELLALMRGHAAVAGSRAYVRDVRAILAGMQRMTKQSAFAAANAVAAKNRRTARPR